MKQLCLILCLVNSLSYYSQQAKIIAEMPLDPDLKDVEYYSGGSIQSSKDWIIHSKSFQFNNQPTKYNFLVINKNTGEQSSYKLTYDSDDNNYHGTKQWMFIQGDYLYEFVKYEGTGMVITHKPKVAILKRKISNFVIEKTVWLSDSFYTYLGYKTGFYLFSGQSRVVQSYDFNLNLIWEEKFLEDTDIRRLPFWEVQTDSLGNACGMVTFRSVPEKQDGIIVTPTETHIIRFNTKGLQNVFKPEVEDNGIILSNTFNYNFEKDELNGFYISKPKSSDKESINKRPTQYNYYVWSSEGILKEKKTHSIITKDLLSDELKTQLKMIDTDKWSDENENFCGELVNEVFMQSTSTGNTIVLIHSLSSEFSKNLGFPLKNSTTVFLIDSEGELIWGNVLYNPENAMSSEGLMSSNLSTIPICTYQSNEMFYLPFIDLALNYKDDERYIVGNKPTGKERKDYLLAVAYIDNNGSISYKKALGKEYNDLKLINFDYSNDTDLITGLYVNTKTGKLVVIDFVF